MNSKEEVLKNSTVEGTVVKLPNVQLDRKVYQDVAKSLELIGGKWKGGKVMGFVFPTDPSELLEQIAGGEKRNLKKEYQFFATPEALANELVELAGLTYYQSILEPSAGQGAIIKAIHRVVPDVPVGYCETMDINNVFLSRLTNVVKLSNDFFDLRKAVPEKHDRIIANPPFSNNQDIDHIKEMFFHLKKGGRLVSIASKHWQLSNNKKETEFREWLELVNAEIIEIPAGAFKESGTNISSVIIVIDK